MGPDNIGEFNKVKALAIYLVSFATSGTSDLSFTNDQAARIIELWNQLETYHSLRYDCEHSDMLGNDNNCLPAYQMLLYFVAE